MAWSGLRIAFWWAWSRCKRVRWGTPLPGLGRSFTPAGPGPVENEFDKSFLDAVRQHAGQAERLMRNQRVEADA